MDIKSLTGNNYRAETAAKARAAEAVAAGSTAPVANTVSGEAAKIDQAVRTTSANFLETIAPTEHSPVAKSAGGSAKTAKASGESVTWTKTALTMTAALSNAAEVPFNSTRVAEIKAAIAEGRYPINNQRLAQRILDFEDMLAR